MKAYKSLIFLLASKQTASFFKYKFFKTGEVPLETSFQQQYSERHETYR